MGGRDHSIECEHHPGVWFSGFNGPDECPLCEAHRGSDQPSREGLIQTSTGGVDPRVPTEQVAPAAPRGESPDLSQPPREGARIKLWKCPTHGLIDDYWHGWAEATDDETLLIKACGLCPRGKMWTEGEITEVELIPASTLQAAEAERDFEHERANAHGNVLLWIWQALDLDDQADGETLAEYLSRWPRDKVAEAIFARLGEVLEQLEAAEAREYALRQGVDSVIRRWGGSPKILDKQVFDALGSLLLSTQEPTR